MDTEKDKRHMAAALVSLCGAMLLLAVVMFTLAATLPQKFDNINGHQTDKIVSVRSDWKRYDNDDAIKQVSAFEKARYTKYHGSLGSTTHITFTFYDKNGRELFQLTDIGNRNIIMIQLPNGTKHLYQAHDKK